MNKATGFENSINIKEDRIEEQCKNYLSHQNSKPKFSLEWKFYLFNPLNNIPNEASILS